MTEEKFKVKSELAVYEALQEDGKMSYEEISKKTNILPSTIQYAYERLRKRDFFKIMAVADLKKFSEVPIAIVGFSNIDPLKLKQLTDEFSKKQETVMLLHGEKEVVLILVGEDKDKLTKMLLGIMKKYELSPPLYIVSPNIVKFDPKIPDKVLEAVYNDLPDRRIKV